MPLRPRCRQFGRLPKLTTPLRSINFKRTTPGAVTPLTDFRYRPGGYLHDVLDRQHPAAKVQRQELAQLLPHGKTHSLFLRMVPQALLQRPQNIWPDPPFHYDTKGTERQAKMSFVKVVSIKGIHKSAVIRNRISYRLKTALSMIVIRGADVKLNKKGQEEIVFNENEAGRHWIMPNWTYIAAPTLEVYRMPYTELVPALRQLLLRVNSHAAFAERNWMLRPKASDSPPQSQTNEKGPRTLKEAKKNTLTANKPSTKAPASSTPKIQTKKKGRSAVKSELSSS
ncbi:unnamed protein product [Somion occarium]|uniref:Uncharacterized protein n=1 Tax=Somion occarium TaxID=3059160 RepID=A0ABP1DPE4_9APHY